jgi:hypothetical protein
MIMFPPTITTATDWYGVVATTCGYDFLPSVGVDGLSGPDNFTEQIDWRTFALQIVGLAVVVAFVRMPKPKLDVHAVR